jgi:hypothetical protein
VAVAGEIAIGHSTVLRVGRRHGVADGGGTVRVGFGDATRELRDFHHVRLLLNPGEAGLLAAKADGMQPVARGGDFEPPFLAKGHAIALKAHEQRVALRRGVEKVGAAIAIEIIGAETAAAAFAKRMVLRLRPFAGGFLQQNHQTRVRQQRDVVAPIAVQIAGDEGFGVVVGRIERELAFLRPRRFLALHAEHELVLISDEGDVGFLVAVPVARDERQRGAADDERLFLEA